MTANSAFTSEHHLTFTDSSKLLGKKRLSPTSFLKNTKHLSLRLIHIFLICESFLILQKTEMNENQEIKVEKACLIKWPSHSVKDKAPSLSLMGEQDLKPNKRQRSLMIVSSFNLNENAFIGALTTRLHAKQFTLKICTSVSFLNCCELQSAHAHTPHSHTHHYCDKLQE